jgi:hypothetical protein
VPDRLPLPVTAAAGAGCEGIKRQPQALPGRFATPDLLAACQYSLSVAKRQRW